MSDKKLAKQIGSYALTIASAVATAVIIIHSYDAIKFHHLKQSEQIIKECNSLNLDYSYMITSNENCSVLNIKTGEPIFIEYDSAMPKKEIDIIHRAVDYYENIFKTIDEGYDFELISNDSESSKDAIISIKNRNSKLFGFGWGNANGKNRSVHRALSEKNVIAKSYICLDWDSIQESGDAYSYYVILHELAHSFGINDVYYKGSNKNTNCQYGNTIMNSSATTFYELYPNDYGLLQAMYSKEYIKQTNYENAIKVMKEKIDIYEKYFYDSLAENLKNKDKSYFLEEEKEFLENLSFEWHTGIFNGEEHTVKVDIKNGICNFMIQDRNGHIIEQDISETIYSKGILFIKCIELKNISSYDRDDTNSGCKLMFFVARNSNGELVIQDNLYNNGTKIKETRIPFASR